MQIVHKLKQNAVVFGLLFAGLLVLFYPAYSNLFNQMQAHRMITDYRKAVDGKSDDTKKQEIAKAHRYNTKLINEKVPESFAKRMGIKHDSEYEGLLNPSGNGMMGIVSIPSIDVELPIYHYTTNEILEKGAGHLFGSSLPVGGKSAHSVITAHRGLPSAKMFTDLDELRNGDKFFIEVLGQRIAYKVDRIKTVKPEDTQDMKIIEGEDLVTLVTCTPYGQNTHRLLVRGHRVAYNAGDEVKEPTHRRIPWAHILCIMLGVFLAVDCYVLAVRLRRNKGR